MIKTTLVKRSRPFTLRLLRRMDMVQKMRHSAEVAKVFTPSAPIDNSTLFAGRTQQILKVINAINQRGQHAVLYGERGVGKTSLANVLHDILESLEQGDIKVLAVNCDASTTFSTLWNSVFRELTMTEQKPSAGFGKATSSESIPANEYLAEKVSPDDVRYMFEQVKTPTVVIIDEIDRISKKGDTTKIADTIKTLSDHSINTTLVLVGVADSVDDLIAEHRSVERALVQIQMPRMSTKELHEILDKGLTNVKMTIAANAKNRIADLSQGLPHYTHLLGLHAAQHAINDSRSEVDITDVNHAIRLAVEQAQQSIIRGYHKATNSPRGNLYAQVLLACALAPSDDLGYFSSSDVRDPLSEIMHRRYEIPAFSQHLKDFCGNERGPILERTGYSRRYRFRFINPLMEPYIIMNGLKRGLITEDMFDTNPFDDASIESTLPS